MSTTAKMYYMKPVFTLPDKLPRAKVMYEMKNIHVCSRIASKIEQQAPHPEITILELRQEKILGQLAELKKIIANLQDIVSNTNQTDAAIVKNEEIKHEDPVTVNIVVKADRYQIPYSLLALKTIWKDTIFNISYYSHSEESSGDSFNYVDCISNFEKNMQSNKVTKECENDLNVINLTLIWKNISILETSVDVYSKHLLGETNLLRFLSRTIKSHNYEDNISFEQLNTINIILDCCYNIDKTKCVNSGITLFNNLLSNGNMWLASKSQPTIADFSAWSIIKNQKPKLSNNIMKWFNRCEKEFCC